MALRGSLLACLYVLAGCGSDDAAPLREQPQKLVDRLNGLSGLTAIELGHFTDGSIVYDLRVVQPVDHDIPEGDTFEQRVILRYLGRTDDATVMITDGYAIQYYDDINQRVYLSEQTLMLKANQVEVEHRYFADSTPGVPDWSKLTIAQAAAHHHRIRQLLAPLFTGPWVATGGSKSGMAALYYRRFFPDDVVATVSYVAPSLHGRGDTRVAEYLAQIGDVACREALTAMQRAALDDTLREGSVSVSRRDAMVAAFRERYGSTNLTLLGDDYAYEIALVDAPFTFWQYSDPALCATVPDDQTPDDVFFAFLDDVVTFGGLTNVGVVAARPFRYQSLTQLGTPSIHTEAIADLLQHGDDDAGDAQLPDAAIPPFDLAPMQDIEAWATSASSQVLLIYGAYDPWTGAKLELSGAERMTVIAASSNHNAHVTDLSPADMATVDVALGRWTGVAIDTTYRSALTLAMPLRRDLQLRR